jgi:hypothetical protein
MRPGYWLTLILALAAACHGPSQPRPETCYVPTPSKSTIASDLDHGNIEGWVFNVRGVAPIWQALITLHPGRLLISTDTAGFFRFTNVKQGRYLLTVQAIGFERVQDSITHSAAGVDVVAVLVPAVIRDYECVISVRNEKRSRP